MLQIVIIQIIELSPYTWNISVDYPVQIYSNSSRVSNTLNVYSKGKQASLLVTSNKIKF